MKSSSAITSLVVTVLFFGAFPSVAEEEARLAESNKAVSSISSHEKRVNAAQIQYVQACITSTKRLIEELKRTRGEEIRRENLPTANAIQHRITAYEKMLEQYRESLASLRLGGTAQAGVAPKLPDRVYIWNSFQGDRGVRVVDIELRKGGKLIRELKGIELGIQKNKAIRTIVKLPKVDFDEIEVQVMEWHGHSAGLAEVSLVRGKENLTSKYDLNANLRSPDWDPKHLNDGDLDTEWLGADGRRAQINFKIRKPDPEAVEKPEELGSDAEGEQDDIKPELDEDGFFGLPTERDGEQ